MANGHKDHESHRLVRELHKAREDVKRARVAHGCGEATDDDWNRANDRLAKAHERLDKHHSGTICTGRDRDELGDDY
jgi:hypothetical protein